MFKKFFKKKKLKKKFENKVLENQETEPSFQQLSFPLSSLSTIDEDINLTNAQIISNTRFVVDAQGKIFFTSGSLANQSLAESLKKWIFCEEDFKSCICDLKENTISLRVKKAEKFIRGNTIYASNYEPNNVYHFFMDCIFDAVLAKAKGIKIDNLVIHENLSDKFRSALLTMFPQANHVNGANGEIITAENLILFGKRNVQWHWLRKGDEEGKKLSDGRQFFNSHYLQTLRNILFTSFNIKARENYETNAAKKIVFLPRKSDFRNTLNQKAILEFLKIKCAGHELIILDPITASFGESGNILSNSDLFICQEGAALFNMIFANSDKMQILTWPFFDATKQDSIYQDIAKILGFKFTTLPAFWLKSEKNFSGDFAPHLASESLSDLILPIDLIDKFLTEFLNSDHNSKI